MKDKIIEKELSYILGGIFFEIQKELGRFYREKQYADALEKKLTERKINFKKEYPIEVTGQKSNFVDFIIENKALVDLKAKPFIEKEDLYQMKRYLEAADIELGLIVNFQDKYLKPKRILNSKKFVDSDKFVVSDRSAAFLPIVLVTSAVIIEFVVTAAILVYYFNNSNFGVRLSAEALTAASAGIEDGLIKVVRNKNYNNTAGYALNVGNRQTTITVCKDTCSGNGTHQITTIGQALTQRRQIVAVVETNSITGEVRIISIKEVAL
jgi:GxxExxY protein